MKVIAFNGSPRGEGNTRRALSIVADELGKEGVEAEIVEVGSAALRGCAACGGCARNKDGRCVLPDDGVNARIAVMRDADGILLGSPVHFSGMGATMKAFLDRAFYVASANGGLFRHKVGAAVVAVRRSGGVATFDQLGHYLAYSEMLVPGSNYWNVIHGTAPDEAEGDEEGVQIMRVLGRNMAWLLKLVEAGRPSLPPPEREKKRYTSFIR
ncbi:MAG: flavodoxin family protein [Spirochaetaceae bacterium]|nr:flavodoxin family protein [Spirochaetaceae bacterium]